jgi:hypothetical protein
MNEGEGAVETQAPYTAAQKQANKLCPSGCSTVSLKVFLKVITESVPLRISNKYGSVTALKQ